MQLFRSVWSPHHKSAHDDNDGTVVVYAQAVFEPQVQHHHGKNKPEVQRQQAAPDHLFPFVAGSLFDRLFLPLPLLSARNAES